MSVVKTISLTVLCSIPDNYFCLSFVSPQFPAMSSPNDKLSWSRFSKWRKMGDKKVPPAVFRELYTCLSSKSAAAVKLRCHFILCFCVYVCEQMVEPLSRWTNIASVFFMWLKVTDSVAVALSELLNPELSALRVLFRTLATIHVNINNSRNGGEYWVPDTQDPYLCILSNMLTLTRSWQW